MKKPNFPNEGDLVLCTITSVQPHCAFAKLDEFENLEGMIHISEVASSWIRDIRAHVKEGKQVVCRVLRVEEAKGHINLSIRRVSEADRGEKFDQMSRSKRAVKLLQKVVEATGLSAAAAETLKKKLTEEFGEPYYGFEEAAKQGTAVLVSRGIEEKVATSMTEVASKSITFPEVEVSRVATLQSEEPDGLEQIKKVLALAEKAGVKVSYISAPRYKLTLTATDYKEGDRKMNATVEEVLHAFRKHGEGAVQEK